MPMALNDRNMLIEKARIGDIEAFHMLFTPFQKSLQSYLYRMLNDRQDVDDLTHDTFLKAFDKIDTFKGQSSLKTWVFAIATNLSIDKLRDRKRWAVDAQEQSRTASLESPEIATAYLRVNQLSPQGHYEIREHIDFCFTCISKTLPIEQQIALLLKDIYGFKVKEITLILNKTVGVVKHLLHDARQTMTRIFEKRCSLINKQGICYQCSELNGLFNPDQEVQIALNKLRIVQERDKQSQAALFELRTQLVQDIDPLHALGSELHDTIMQRIRNVIGEIE